MAKFDIFYPIISKNEGGYANKKNDSGGETWKGISRNNYPSWSGWVSVDKVKALSDFPINGDYKHICEFMNVHLRADLNLEDKVHQFYKSSQWDTIKGDQINNQSIANFIADWGVNSYYSTPIKHLQIILKLNVDGHIGPATLSALNSFNQEGIFNELKSHRIKFYHDIVKAKPQNEEFLEGWIQRTNSFKYTPQ